jgi:PKD repeat protein
MKALGRAALVGALAIAIVGMGFPLGSLTTLASSAPSFDVLTLTPEPSEEGQVVTLHGEFTDADPGEAHTVHVAWGGGVSSTTTSLALGARTFDVTRMYPDDRSTATASDTFDVVVTLSDSAGLSVQRRLSHTVRNVAPTATLALSPTTIMEGESVVVTLTITDPSPNDLFTATVSFGDGSSWSQPTLSNVRSYTLPAHTYDLPGTYELTAGVTDDDTLIGTATASLVVGSLNTAPDGLVASWQPVLEDDLGTLNGTFNDPDTEDTHTVLVLWGDGSPQETLALEAGRLSFSMTHTYAAAGTYKVVVSVTDPFDANVASLVDATVLVRNSAPENVALSVESITAGESATLTVSFTDVDADDVHAVLIDWGDGTTDVLALGSGVSTFSAEHPYADAGTYQLTATVSDPDGTAASASTTLVVTSRPARNLLDELAALIYSWNLDEGGEQSLMSKIDSAREALADGSDPCSPLKALANHVSAQTGKKLSSEQVGEFRPLFDQVVDEFGCAEPTPTVEQTSGSKGSARLH